MTPGMLVKRGLLLAVTGVSLYLLAPALLEVFGAFDELDEINPLWFAGMICSRRAATRACGPFRRSPCGRTAGAP
jgi:hypothetical protein